MPHATSGFTANELILQAIATKGRTAADLQGDTTLRSQLLEGLELIQLDYCGRNDWEFLHDKGTMAISANTSTYTLSSNVEKIEILYDKTHNRIIRPVNDKELTRGDPNEDWTGDPLVYSRWGGDIILTPTPTANDTIYYRCKILPTYLSAIGSYPTVPRKYQKTLLYGLRAWFYDITDDNRADRELARYEQGIIQDWEKDTLELDDCNRFLSYEEWLQDPITTNYTDFLMRYFG